MGISTIRKEWTEMDVKFKAIFITLIVAGSAFLVFQNLKNTEKEKLAAEKKLEQRAAKEAAGVPGSPGANDGFKFSVTPKTNRNQGLEEMKVEIQLIKEDMQKLLVATQNPQADKPTDKFTPRSGQTTPPPAPSLPPAPDLNKPLPPVNFDQPMGVKPDLKAAPRFPDMPGALPVKEDTKAPQMKVWASDKNANRPPKKPEPLSLIIPVNSALESVMLSGINAKPSGSIASSVGSVTSANDVGAPFVTRLKGDAILPNGWKLSDLGDCFLGGSGVAVLSAERVYAISNTISCISPDGEVYESPIKAYGLDVDGTQGIAGRVVNKQGAILMQAAITGIASGLGSALAPTALASSNTNAQSGQAQGFQTANPSLIAQTALGQGINQASSQLSKFYLEFARETFPVIEVVAGTRITWILKQSIEFKRIKKLDIK
jgi:conjugal transfer pilus assembly protein TraB